MNNLNFLRHVNRVKIFNGNQHKYVRVLQHLARRFASATILSQKLNEKQVFRDALPAVIDKLIASPKISQLPEVSSWIKTILEHNITAGKQSRGLMTISAYEMLEKPENITEEYIKLSKVLGWCLEMTQGYFCIVDDIMDGSTTRRGSPCWYRMPNVGMGAVNDYVLLSGCVTETLKMYFMNTPHYVDLLRLFHKGIFYTAMGQHMDCTTAGCGSKFDYSLFTMERFETIGRYKTTFYTFQLPVLLALTLVKDVDKSMYTDVDDFGIELGKLYQIQDDYIDCYGDEALSGKIGSDIQEGKCTWLAVTALQLCNSEQKEIFTKYYGSKKPEEVAIIKSLYNELQLPKLFKQKEIEMYDDIVSRACAQPSKTVSNIYINLLNQLYNRSR